MAIIFISTSNICRPVLLCSLCRRLPSARLQAASIAKQFFPLGFNCFWGKNSHREHFPAAIGQLPVSSFGFPVPFLLVSMPRPCVSARLHPVTANKTKHLEGGSRAKFLLPTAAATRRKSQHPIHKNLYFVLSQPTRSIPGCFFYLFYILSVFPCRAIEQ